MSMPIKWKRFFDKVVTVLERGLPVGIALIELTNKLRPQPVVEAEEDEEGGQEMLCRTVLTGSPQSILEGLQEQFSAMEAGKTYQLHIYEFLEGGEDVHTDEGNSGDD
jgi:hypothetical protein